MNMLAEIEAVMLADRILVLEHGSSALDTALILPRTRRHAMPGFNALRTSFLGALGAQEDFTTIL